jgi:tripartite-type tricarboxylate transporter receptor subunit TctC
MMPTRRFAAGLLSAGLMVAGPACGQDYPGKVIRIVTTGAGGGSDFVARILAQGIAGPLGQPVIVDNRTPSVFATETVSKAPPDGYTFLITGGALWIYPLLYKAPYDPILSFVPISLLTREVFVLTVHPSLPARSVRELIALARARPGELNYASGSPGSTYHLAAELFKAMAGVNAVHVAYKSPSLAVTAVVSGEAQMTIYDASLVMPHAKSGKLRALAVTSATPSALVPGLPAIASAVPGYEAVGSTGMWSPARTPAAIINRINQEVARVLGRPDVRQKILSAWVEPVGSTPEQLAALMKADIERVGKVIKDADIKVY